MDTGQEQLYSYLRDRIEWAFCSDTNTGSFDGTAANSGFGSKCLLAPWAFSQKPIVVAVNQLPDHLKTLVRFVVGLPVTQTEFTNLTVPVYFAFYQQYLVFRRLNSTSVPKAQRLIEYALMNYKLQLSKQELIADKQIMGAIEIKDRKTFRETWLPRLAIMKSVIATMEREALSSVLRNMDEPKAQQYA